MSSSSSLSIHSSFTSGKSQRWILSDCLFIDASYKVLVDFFCHKRNHRSCCFGNCYQCSIKCHVSIDLILLHAFCPETFTASSYIPVTHLIYKFLQCSCSFPESCSLQDQSSTVFTTELSLLKEPFIHNRKLVIIQMYILLRQNYQYLHTVQRMHKYSTEYP